jgi:hypothetical protein
MMGYPVNLYIVVEREKQKKNKLSHEDSEEVHPALKVNFFKFCIPAIKVCYWKLALR